MANQGIQIVAENFKNMREVKKTEGREETHQLFQADHAIVCNVILSQMFRHLGVPLGELRLRGHLSPAGFGLHRAQPGHKPDPWTAAQTHTKNRACAHLAHRARASPTRKRLHSHEMLPISSKVLTEALVTCKVFHTAAQSPVMAAVAMVFDIKMDKATLNTIQLCYMSICTKQNTGWILHIGWGESHKSHLNFFFTLLLF